VARVLRMPGVAANATEAVLAEWLVAEATDFAATDALATVETEKAAVDVEADADGRVIKVLVPPGAQVEVGDPIAVLGDPGEEVDDLAALLESLGVAPAVDVVVPERRDVPDPAPAPAPAAPAPVPTAPAARTGGRIFSSPLARKIAKEHGLTVDQIPGTGPHGRVLRRDVDAAVAAREAAPPPTTAPGAPPGEAASYDEQPHSRLKLATARRLTESKQQAPHFYLRATVRAEPLLALRADLNADAEAHDGVRVSVNDLVVKAVAAAHRRVPGLNVTWTPEALRQWSTVDVAVAVATDRGLVTPVLRDAGSLTVTAIASEVRELAGRARDGKLKQHELEGGSITVTNLGMYGVEEFAAILNPPQAAILAVGAIRDEPVVEAGAVVPGKVMTVTLSVDHRPVDGVLAARWLAALTELLEHPARAIA
jgi:pyruvate dehydrogenase E2 component (dihydrolipoamide acetyltransferase)